MNARDTEALLLDRCAAAAQGISHATDQRDANVFRLAAMVIQSRFPQASQGLMQASNDYFLQHPEEQLPPVEVVHKGWVISLPRLRDMLSRQLEKSYA
jgi:hypothetical protein